MSNLSVSIRSADLENASKITNILYRMVEDKKIKSFKINTIKKGENSIDFSPFVHLVENIDLESMYRQGIDSGFIILGEATIGIRLIRELLNTVKDGIDVAEKLPEIKSFFGIRCSINRKIVVKYGRSFGVEPFDTILTSATPATHEDMFFGENRWGEIKIARANYPLIKYIAMFVKHPVGAIVTYGKVKEIKYNPDSGKSTVYLDGKPKEFKNPVPYDEEWPHHDAHGTVYTTLDRIKNADTLADVYPKLDKKRGRNSKK